MADVLGFALEGGHDLHACRTGADDGDATPVGNHTVVPARGVDGIAVEGIETRNVRCEGVMQHASRGYQEVRHQFGAVRSRDLPGGSIEAGRSDLSVQPQMVVEIVAVYNLAKVALNLRPRCEQARPIRLRRE